MGKTSRLGTPEPEEKGNSHFLLLGLVNSVAEKHGGHMQLNEKDNTISISVPEGRKTACFQELEIIMDISKPLSGFPSFVDTRKPRTSSSLPGLGNKKRVNRSG